MKYRPSKAAGSFDCTREGAFELLVQMEADPGTYSYAEFDFTTVLPARKAALLANHAAFLLRHRVGLFVVTPDPKLDTKPTRFRLLWSELDTLLAQRGIWLLSAPVDELRREPEWTNALEIARCAQAEVDPNDRERVVAHLSRVKHAPLLDCAKLCAASVDSFDALLSLVSSGHVFLDPHRELSPRTELTLEPPPNNSIGWLSANSSHPAQIQSAGSR